MSEPGDELSPLPEPPEDKPKLSRSPYIALGVAALVVSTVFATVAALASTRDEAAPAPRSVDTVETTTADTYTTDPVATSVPGSTSKKAPKSSGATTTTTSGDETTTEDETTTGGGTTTKPGHTTTHRPPNTTTPPPNQAPSASFTSSCTNLECDFDAGGSSDPDGSIASYSWSFGGSGQTIHHAFDAPGTFHVTLTVTDNKGKTSSTTNDVTVNNPSTTSGN
jgi:PKD repeat protein